MKLVGNDFIEWGINPEGGTYFAGWGESKNEFQVPYVPASSGSLSGDRLRVGRTYRLCAASPKGLGK